MESWLNCAAAPPFTSSRLGIPSIRKMALPPRSPGIGAPEDEVMLSSREGDTRDCHRFRLSTELESEIQCDRLVYGYLQVPSGRRYKTRLGDRERIRPCGQSQEFVCSVASTFWGPINPYAAIHHTYLRASDWQPLLVGNGSFNGRKPSVAPLITAEANQDGS